MIHRVENVMGLFSGCVRNIPTATQDSDYVLNGILLIKEILTMPDLQYFTTLAAEEPHFLCSLTQFASLSIRSTAHLQTHLRGAIPLARNPFSTQGANNNR